MISLCTSYFFVCPPFICQPRTEVFCIFHTLEEAKGWDLLKLWLYFRELRDGFKMWVMYRQTIDDCKLRTGSGAAVGYFNMASSVAWKYKETEQNSLRFTCTRARFW